MPVAKRTIISGSIALNNEKKIAEAIAVRSAALRAVLSKESKEHAAYLANCDAEKKEAKAEVLKVQKQLATLKANLADIGSRYYDDKRAWIKSKKEADALREELVAKIKEAKALAEEERVKTNLAVQLEARTRDKIAKREAAVISREVSVLARETAAKKAEKQNEREAARLKDNTLTLSEKERDYTIRAKALLLREEKAEAILKREEAVAVKEERVDKKAKTVQDKDKELQVERVALARERARLGRIRHELEARK